MELEGGIVRAIGRTPLIRLSRLFKDQPFEVYGKMEWMNPGGSAKDRPALFMLREAIRRGEVTSDSVIVESSSGNLAISLAQLCRYLGLRFICVVDPRTTQQHLQIIRSFHGEIDLVSVPDEATGEFLPARIRRVAELVSQIPNAFWTNQYASPDNALAHSETTMREIGEQIGTDRLFILRSKLVWNDSRGVWTISAVAGGPHRSLRWMPKAVLFLAGKKDRENSQD